MHAPDPTVQTVKCDVCGSEVSLQIRPLTLAEAAWRWFDCPHCKKPNFIRIAGQILRVVRDQQES